MGTKITGKKQGKTPSVGKGKPPAHTQFKKGVSGNPQGRPKLPDIREAMALMLSEEKQGLNALQAVLMALRNKAVKGDVRAAQILLDRAYGSAVQKTSLTDDEGNNLPAVILQGVKPSK